MFTGRAVPSTIVRDRYGGLTASVGAHRFYGPPATSFLAVPATSFLAVPPCLFRVSSTSRFSRFPLIPRFPCFPEFPHSFLRFLDFRRFVADSLLSRFPRSLPCSRGLANPDPLGYDDGSDYRCSVRQCSFNYPARRSSNPTDYIELYRSA